MKRKAMDYVREALTNSEGLNPIAVSMAFEVAHTPKQLSDAIEAIQGISPRPTAIIDTEVFFTCAYGSFCIDGMPEDAQKDFWKYAITEKISPKDAATYSDRLLSIAKDEYEAKRLDRKWVD